MNKNLKKKILEYTAVFEPADEGGYVVSVPTLAGCMTEGDTFEEALANIKDAIHGYLQVLKSEGSEMPQEKANIVVAKITVANPAVSSL